MNREVHISIAPGTIFTALFIIAGAYVFWLLRDLVLLVITAIVIASAIEPGVAFLSGTASRASFLHFLYTCSCPPPSSRSYTSSSRLSSQMLPTFFRQCQNISRHLMHHRHFQILQTQPPLWGQVAYSRSCKPFCRSSLFSLPIPEVLCSSLSPSLRNFSLTLIIVLSFYFASRYWRR